MSTADIASWHPGTVMQDFSLRAFATAARRRSAADIGMWQIDDFENQIILTPRHIMEPGLMASSPSSCPETIHGSFQWSTSGMDIIDLQTKHDHWWARTCWIGWSKYMGGFLWFHGLPCTDSGSACCWSQTLSLPGGCRDNANHGKGHLQRQQIFVWGKVIPTILPTNLGDYVWCVTLPPPLFIRFRKNHIKHTTPNYPYPTITAYQVWIRLSLLHPVLSSPKPPKKSTFDWAKQQLWCR